MVTSRRVTLARRPQNQVELSDFGSDEVELPALQDGEFLMNVEYLSIDPTIRGWMSYDTYLPKIGIGDVIRSAGAGEVLESRNAAYPVGMRVFGMPGWQEHAVLTGGVPIPEGVTYEQALSVFGVTGLTAYVGLEDIGKPQAGETVVVIGLGGVGNGAGGFTLLDDGVSHLGLVALHGFGVGGYGPHGSYRGGHGGQREGCQDCLGLHARSPLKRHRMNAQR